MLLIDEIDKADIEFPNDLLWELDQMEFFIPETHETIKATQRPVVIITSNAEKELPDAFLRRCVFHFIEFPDAAMMERIVRVHHPGLDERLLQLALQAFYWLRGVAGLQKKPSTSELIDWVQALQVGGVRHEDIVATMPFIGVLLKKDHDVDVAVDALRRRPRPAIGRRLVIAAGHVNWHYLLILLLPSVVAVVVVALTWYSRQGRRPARAAEDKQRPPRREVRRSCCEFRRFRRQTARFRRPVAAPAPSGAQVACRLRAARRSAR